MSTAGQPLFGQTGIGQIAPANPNGGFQSPSGNDTFIEVWRHLSLMAPSLGPARAQLLIKHAFRQIAERRRWSWLTKQSQFSCPGVVNDGTIQTRPGSVIIQGLNTNWDPTIIGQQLRIGTSNPVMEIAEWLSPTQLVLDQPYVGVQYESIGYNITQWYFIPPSDFHAFISIWDPQNNWQLWTGVDQRLINIADSQRAMGGFSYCVSFRDYSSTRQGVLSDPVQIAGTSGPIILADDAQYQGPNPGFFQLQIVDPGIVGTATFSWNKNGGGFSIPIPLDSFPQYFQDGVGIVWPQGITFATGDTWIIQATPGTQQGLPRFELWPHNTATPYVYPFLYESRAPDLTDANASLPGRIRGDVLLEMGLAAAARWPGVEGAQNPYFNLQTALTHEGRAEKMIMELERQDDEVHTIALLSDDIPFTPWPFADSFWLQSHAI